MVSSVDFGDLVSFDLFNIGSRGKEARKGHGEVVAQGAQLTALVGEVVDEARVLAVLAGEDVAELKGGRVEGDAAVAAKYRTYGGTTKRM